jgi:hypothetical protein
MVLDVQQAKPALLAKRQPDHAAQFHEFGLAEVRVQALPERVIGVQVPGNRLRVGKRRLLPVVVEQRTLEIQQVLDMILDQGADLHCLHRPLVAAVLALHRAGYVQSAKLFDRVVADAIAVEVPPRVCEEPEGGWYMRTDSRTLGARRSLPLATLHLDPHIDVHLLDRHVADALSAHWLLLRFADMGCSRAA